MKWLLRLDKHRPFQITVARFVMFEPRRIIQSNWKRVKKGEAKKRRNTAGFDPAINPRSALEASVLTTKPHAHLLLSVMSFLVLFSIVDLVVHVE